MTIWKQMTGLKATFLTLKCHAKMLMKRMKKEKKVQNVFPIHFKMCVWGGGVCPRMCFGRKYIKNAVLMVIALG